uniref:Reticulon-3 n=1 Tax=Pipistrellus kuhlii TaxID=59472 RepID=A0A7J7RTR3_PIPKU|nr:reticulon 3 [Pipistrellus kuhlii]
MADLSAATQSPSVSSTSSGAEPSAPGGAGGPGACPALGTKSCGSSCADSFVSSSSSQPVSLFSTSQADLLIFSVPIVYEKYKTQIDHYVGIVRDQTKSIVEKIQAKLPGIAKKKAE